MKILANENFPLLIVQALRDQQHDVVWVRTDMPGATDDTILQRAQDEQRLVVTFDKDFGELAYRFGLPASCGIILFRLKMRIPPLMRGRVLEVIGSQLEWSGCFVVATEDRVRIRPLPFNR